MPFRHPMFCLALAALGVATALIGGSQADESGFASMHDQSRVGKKMCFTDHAHYGSSFGLGSKKSAQIEAIKSWASFTDFEYGSDWANFNKAVKKSISCTSTGGWGCNVEATPCR